MRFDLVAFLGGLAVGASAMALYGTSQSTKLGQGVVSGGGPSGGFGGGSYGPRGSSYAPGGAGVYSGPPGAFGGGFMGPSVLEAEGETGPIVSVPPIIHGGDGAFGGSFFGVNVAPWFWPLNVLPIMQWPLTPKNEEMICKKVQGAGEETLVCQRRYPVQAVAWGPPSGWL